MSKSLQPINQASIEIHGACNYRCSMCPHTSGREKSFLKKLPLDLFKNIINQLVEHGCRAVNLQGSGEPLINRDLPKYIEIAKQAGLETAIVTNGYKLTPQVIQNILTAGINEVRISVIGYNRESYQKWMGRDAFDTVYKNAEKFLELNQASSTNCKFSSYHLVFDTNTVQTDCEQYRCHWIDKLNIPAEIWMMHNWSGNYDAGSHRLKDKKRSCGRPFSPYLNIRAGGLDGHHGAVVPCCFVLGNDSVAVMGHLDEQSISEVLDSPFSKNLRTAHSTGNFDQIEACKNCDQLYEAQDSLVWTNIPDKAYGQIKNNPGLDFREFDPAKKS